MHKNREIKPNTFLELDYIASKLVPLFLNTIHSKAHAFFRYNNIPSHMLKDTSTKQALAKCQPSVKNHPSFIKTGIFPQFRKLIVKAGTNSEQETQDWISALHFLKNSESKIIKLFLLAIQLTWKSTFFSAKALHIKLPLFTIHTQT